MNRHTNANTHVNTHTNTDANRDTAVHTDPDAAAGPAAGGQDGSVVAEYGLIAIVGATIASLVVKWATGGAIWQLFDAVLDKVRVLLGT